MTKPYKYIVGGVKCVRQPDRAYNTDLNDVQISRRFQNLTDTELWISSRDGVVLESKPAARYLTTDEFKVIVSYTGKKSVIKNCLRLLIESPNRGIERSSLLTAFKQTANSEGKDDTHKTVTVEYVVTQNQIVQSGGVFYLEDLDVLLESKAPGCFRPLIHPFSHNGIDRKTIDALMPQCSDKTFAFMFKAVDNTGNNSYQDRFINIGGRVYQIPIEKDDSRATGVHVISRKHIGMEETNKTAREELITSFYTFADADVVFGFFKTIEEAEGGGPISEIMKDRMSRKAAADKLFTMDQDLELQKLRNKHAELKMEADAQLNSSRSFLEYAKVATAILTAVVGVMGIVSKLSNK
jgi:hypothetical protein